MSSRNSKFLELLSEKFKDIKSASTEIINLKAILQLPKGTEHFMSDIHGQYDSFIHILNNASGVIKNEIDMLFSDSMSNQDRKVFASIIYYPEEKIKDCMVELSLAEKELWYRSTLLNMVKLLNKVSSKYTRSKVRKACDSDFAYIIDELINQNNNSLDREDYYNKIISTIIQLQICDEFIIELSKVIKRMTVDCLHIIGDIYDRGSGPHIIIDRLMQHHNVDIQWGNHDILWMGAASGCVPSIMDVLYISSRHANLDVLEEGYGINLRYLADFATRNYEYSPTFRSKYLDKKGLSEEDIVKLAKINKAVAVLMFKLEGQLIFRNKSFNMEHRLLLDKIDYKNKTVKIDGVDYPLKDCEFPTIDESDPYKLSTEEEVLVNQLKTVFKNSKYLQEHMEFLYNYGSLYAVFNSNLLYHACIPIDEDGDFSSLEIDGKSYEGKDLFDKVDFAVRQAYFLEENDPKKQYFVDMMWYWWCGANSPFFGKHKMATFERVLLSDKEPQKEILNYYNTGMSEQMCRNILKEFGIDQDNGYIINGHVPVKFKKGESPIKANGKLIVIDGGFSKAYQDTTGIAGYTLIYDSIEMYIATHSPFESIESAIKNNIDIYSRYEVVKKMDKEMRIIDTDIGKDILEQIYDLKLLLREYRSGRIKQKK